jgi:deoxyhypusine synthase
MFVIESDATIVAPLILTALLECRAQPTEANRLIDASLRLR